MTCKNFSTQVTLQKYNNKNKKSFDAPYTTTHYGNVKSLQKIIDFYKINDNLTFNFAQTFYISHTEFSGPCGGTITFKPIDIDDVCCPVPGELYHRFWCSNCKDEVNIDFTEYPQLQIDPVDLIKQVLEKID